MFKTSRLQSKLPYCKTNRRKQNINLYSLVNREYKLASQTQHKRTMEGHFYCPPLSLTSYSVPPISIQNYIQSRIEQLKTMSDLRAAAYTKCSRPSLYF